MSRKIKDVLKAIPQSEGIDVILNRTIGLEGGKYRNFDPFLMLDRFAIPSTSLAFRPHGHRGIETILYQTSGEGRFKHEDFNGLKSSIGAGEVQWTSAGRGIMHREVPDANSPGVLEGFQLWVSMPANKKMAEPQYQEIKTDQMVKAEANGIRANVIAGSALGVEAKTISTVPVHYIHYFLPSGAKLSHAVDPAMNSFVYVVKGSVKIKEGETLGDTEYPQDSCIIFERDGDRIDVEAVEETEILLVAGEPLNEPIVRGGPMVMNTEEEIVQAKKDYAECKNGFENKLTYQFSTN